MNLYVTDEGKKAYKKAIEEVAGGKFYTGNLSKMTSNIVNEIKNTKSSMIQSSKKTQITDYPEKVFMLLLLLFIILIILEKRIKL